MAISRTAHGGTAVTLRKLDVRVSVSTRYYLLRNLFCRQSLDRGYNEGSDRHELVPCMYSLNFTGNIIRSEYLRTCRRPRLRESLLPNMPIPLPHHKHIELSPASGRPNDRPQCGQIIGQSRATRPQRLSGEKPGQHLTNRLYIQGKYSEAVSTHLTPARNDKADLSDPGIALQVNRTRGGGVARSATVHCGVILAQKLLDWLLQKMDAQRGNQHLCEGPNTDPVMV